MHVYYFHILQIQPQFQSPFSSFGSLGFSLSSSAFLKAILSCAIFNPEVTPPSAKPMTRLRTISGLGSRSAVSLSDESYPNLQPFLGSL